MIVVKKKAKKSLVIAILAAVLAALVAAALIINSYIEKKQAASAPEKEEVEVDTALGESVYANSPIAYPRVEKEKMEYISIIGNDGEEFGFVWSDELESLVMYCMDEVGNEQYYLPEVLYHEFSDVKYSDLYAVEQGDNFGTIPKLTYLCNSLGTVYFTSRIELSDDSAARSEELKAYGLSDGENPIKVVLGYKNEDKEPKTHTLVIGDKLITGNGYYYMVDGRDFVYTTNSQYIDYLFLGFADYINPTLIIDGLPSDNAFEPYLTTNYTQYKNIVYDKDGTQDDDRDGNADGVSDKVIPGSEVIVTTNVYSSNDMDDYTKEYHKDENRVITFDLKDLAKITQNKSLINVLEGCYVGELENPIRVTVSQASNEIIFATEGDTVYTYEICSIEAILTDSADITDAGVAVGDNNIIKVTYKYYINGEAQTIDNSYDCHGIIDLSSNLIPDESKEALRTWKIGEYPMQRVVFDVEYTKENAVAVEGEIVVSEIVSIYDPETFEELPEVVEGATVAFKYYFIINGRKVEGTATKKITVNDEMTEDEKLIAKALMGVGVDSDTEISVNVDCYCEIVSGFVAYDVKKINYFVVKDVVVSFEYEQASKRDPYYGESFYKNTLENEYSLYPLNASSCESVVQILGGLLNSATTSEGLWGTSVVSLGITPEKLYEYGLYANTVYFELPRYITSIKGDWDIDNFEGYLANLDDYKYYGTIGFTLYISDPDPETGVRYIASDLYDLIATIDGESFKFLDQTFIDFYARRNLVITDISNISEIKFEFFMSDVYGTYKNTLEHNIVWAYGGKYYDMEDLTEEQLRYATMVDLIQVLVDPHGDCMDSKLSQFLEKNGYDYVSLYEFYDKAQAYGEPLGTSYFKEVTETLFYTFYEGSLTEEQQQDGLDNGVLLTRMTVKLGEVENYKYYYTYEFYRVSDRCIMVKLSKVDKNGDVVSEVSDFYVSTFAFKKLVYKYIGILNKEEIDNDASYSAG